MKSTSILQEKSFKKFYAFNFIRKNPLKFIELTFNFTGKSLYFFFKKKKWTPKFCPKFTGKSLYKIFLKKKPFKFFSKKQRKSFGKNFLKKNPCKFLSKKNQLWNLASKIPSRTDKLDTIFSKTLSNRLFLKILWATPQLVSNFIPIRKLFCTFLY